jgi:hypothetical protein
MLQQLLETLNDSIKMLTPEIWKFYSFNYWNYLELKLYSF